jgi:hypothetical protein
MNVTPSNSDLPAFSVARDGQEIGSWSPRDIRQMLADGRLLPTDSYWRPGMRAWLPLGEFEPTSLPSIPPSPAIEKAVYPVHFGSAYGVDRFGFVGKGTISLEDGSVQLQGPRLWPFLPRLGIGLVAWLILAVCFGCAAGWFPKDGGWLLNLLAIMARMMSILGAPFLAMMLTHYYCLSPGAVSLLRKEIAQVTRRDRQITFTAPLDGKGGVKSLFQASDVNTAAEIERQLRTE